MFHDRSVAAPRLLELSHNLLEIKILWQTLDERQALA
jgi:hypothetical protein